MGLSCLLGHDFGHPTHEQERERHGEEVVLTTREVKTCRRCGRKQVLTENTAVMKREAIQTELDTDGPRTEPTTEADEETTTGDAATAAGTGSASEPDTTLSTTQSDGFGSGAESDEPEITDDAVILTDGSTAERHPMEWPDFRSGGENAGQSSAVNDQKRSRDGTGGTGSRFDAEPEPAALCCENCDASYDQTVSSLRVGDLCPRCLSAYLTDSPE